MQIQWSQWSQCQYHQIHQWSPIGIRRDTSDTWPGIVWVWYPQQHGIIWNNKNLLIFIASSGRTIICHQSEGKIYIYIYSRFGMLFWVIPRNNDNQPTKTIVPESNGFEAPWIPLACFPEWGEEGFHRHSSVISNPTGWGHFTGKLDHLYEENKMTSWWFQPRNVNSVNSG